jgi:ankyrin repeat protein
MYTDEDLFDTTNYFDYEYKCKEPEKFRDLITELESDYAPDDVLNNYIKNGGSLDDRCFMKQYGDGAHNIAYIGKSIVIGNKLNLLKQLIELDSEFINSGLLSLAIELERFEIANYLLDEGANPNLYGELGKTPLYYAIMSSNIEIVSRLLSLGADPNKSNYLYFALTWYFTTNNLDVIIIIKLLLEAGAKKQPELLTQEHLDLLETIIV